MDLDADAIRRYTTGAAGDRLADLKAFAEIDSTNSYLMQMPGPAPGRVDVAVTSNQTAGRGRHGKTWQSPPGSGVCLSTAYTFAERPKNLPALTLALGVAAIMALEELGAPGIKIKWPNDLVAMDGKLGGILTEVQTRSGGAVTVVTGIGVNVDLHGERDFGGESHWARQIVDLKSICEPPLREQIIGGLITHFTDAFLDYEKSGLAAVSRRWSLYDWLLGREVVVDTATEQLTGIGAGIAEDGALLVDTPDAGVQHITSGTVVTAGARN